MLVQWYSNIASQKFLGKPNILKSSKQQLFGTPPLTAQTNKIC